MKKDLLILGASSDIGIACIQDLNRNYEHIIAHYFHMNEELEKWRCKLGEKMILVQADLSVEDEVYKLINAIEERKIIPTHIIHFPAQQIQVEKFQKIQWEHFERGFHIAVKSLYLILQVLLPQIAHLGGGKVVVMLSYVTAGMPPKYSADYVTIKYALLGLIKSLSIEYASKGIAINGVSPAFMETKFIDGLHDYFKEENAKASPIGRNLVAEDIIPTIRYFLSDGSKCITGQNLLITGGR